MTSGRSGIVDAERLDRLGLAMDGLDRVSGADPPVIATVEQSNIVHAGIAQDHQRTCRGDLAGTPPRPLLVGVALGVATVEDDRRVAGDPELPDRGVEDVGGSAVPVGRILEPIGVEVQGSRDVILCVLLGDAEVDVEEEEPASRGGFRSLAGEHLFQPVDMHETLVLRELVHGQAGVGRPGREAPVQRRDVVEAPFPQDGGQESGVVRPGAVHDGATTMREPLLVEDALDFGGVHAGEPLGREWHGSRDVATAGVGALAPPVVGAERPHIDDDLSRVVKTSMEGCWRDRGHLGPSGSGRRQTKTPAMQGCRGEIGRTGHTGRTPRDTTCPARQRSDTYSDTWSG